MNKFLILAFLFFIGSVIGWGIELFFRYFTSNDKKWINPGFCKGPYLPLYGVGACILYLLASLEKFIIISNPLLTKLILFIIMAICMTVLEYIAGCISLKFTSIRLWDYSDEWGNINGIICPLFSFFWMLLGAVYYFLIHPYILDALDWLSENLAFSFVVGMFFGIFIIDISVSAELATRLKKYAKENQIEIRYEKLKLAVKNKKTEMKRKYQFFNPFDSEVPLSELIREKRDVIKHRKNKTPHQKG